MYVVGLATKLRQATEVVSVVATTEVGSAAKEEDTVVQLLTVVVVVVVATAAAAAAAAAADMAIPLRVLVETRGGKHIYRLLRPSPAPGHVISLLLSSLFSLFFFSEFSVSSFSRRIAHGHWTRPNQTKVPNIAFTIPRLAYRQ